MGGRLLRGVRVGRSGDASGGAASSGGASCRVLSTEREPLRAEAEARDAVAHVLLQRIEEAHCRCVCRLVCSWSPRPKRNADARER